MLDCFSNERNDENVKFKDAVREALLNKKVTNVTVEWNKIILTFDDDTRAKFEAEGNEGTKLLYEIDYRAKLEGEVT